MGTYVKFDLILKKEERRKKNKREERGEIASHLTRHGDALDRSDVLL